MKMIIILLITLATLTSCQGAYLSDTDSDKIQLDMLNDQTLYYGDFPELKDYRAVAIWIRLNVTYVRGEEGENACGPEELLERGYGDCEDYAILFMNICYIQFNIKFDLATVDSTGQTQRTIDLGGDINHAVVMLNGQLYSAYNGIPITDYESSFHFKFDDIFNR